MIDFNVKFQTLCCYTVIIPVIWLAELKNKEKHTMKSFRFRLSCQPKSNRRSVTSESLPNPPSTYLTANICCLYYLMFIPFGTNIYAEGKKKSTAAFTPRSISILIVAICLVEKSRYMCVIYIYNMCISIYIYTYNNLCIYIICAFLWATNCAGFKYAMFSIRLMTQTL